MRAAVDPETGQLRALTAEEAKTLDDMAKAKAKSDTKGKAAAGGTRNSTTSSVTPGVPFTTPSGAIGVVLDESQMVYSVVTRDADGKLEMECVTGKDEANKALQDKPQSQKNSGGEEQ